MVAPISVTTPVSTAFSNESCCDLLNRCISSMIQDMDFYQIKELTKRIEEAVALGLLYHLPHVLTPELIALNV